jgi:hypothetical protein
MNFPLGRFGNVITSFAFDRLKQFRHAIAKLPDDEDIILTSSLNRDTSQCCANSIVLSDPYSSKIQNQEFLGSQLRFSMIKDIVLKGYDKDTIDKSCSPQKTHQLSSETFYPQGS